MEERTTLIVPPKPDSHGTPAHYPTRGRLRIKPVGDGLRTQEKISGKLFNDRFVLRKRVHQAFPFSQFEIRKIKSG